MSTDDGDIEDDGLSAFRSAWRAMPEEEPPQRGLAELMAAARVKADEMAAARPSLWQRFLDLMRRPQVLALATIMILIGGAVFISQRRDKLEAHDPEGASAPASQATTAGSGSAAGEGRTDEFAPADKAEEAKRELSKEAETAPVVAGPAADRGKDALQSPMPEGTKSTTPRAETEKQTKTASKKASKPMKNKGGDLDSPFLDDGDSDGTATGGKIGGTGAGAGGGGTTGSATSANRPGGGATTTLSPPPDSKPKADPKTEDAAAPSVKQLHDQARTAAAKGDCALVRSLAKKIAAQDAPYYRANIAPDKSLATCLN